MPQTCLFCRGVLRIACKVVGDMVHLVTALDLVVAEAAEDHWRLKKDLVQVADWADVLLAKVLRDKR